MTIMGYEGVEVPQEKKEPICAKSPMVYAVHVPGFRVNPVTKKQERYCIECKRPYAD